MPLYKNNETGIIQYHPRSGIGDSLGSTEVAEDSKPVVPLGADKKTTAKRVKLAKAPKVAESASPKTSGKPAEDDTKAGGV